MKKKINPWIRALLFTLGGSLLGLVYYKTIGCASGACPISSNPGGTMLYGGLLGFLLSGGFCSACRGGSCGIDDKPE